MLEPIATRLKICAFRLSEKKFPSVALSWLRIKMISIITYLTMIKREHWALWTIISKAFWIVSLKRLVLFHDIKFGLIAGCSWCDSKHATISCLSSFSKNTNLLVTVLVVLIQNIFVGVVIIHQSHFIKLEFKLNVFLCFLLSSIKCDLRVQCVLDNFAFDDGFCENGW